MLQTYKAEEGIFLPIFSFNSLITYFKKRAIENVSLKIKLPIHAERNMGFQSSPCLLKAAPSEMLYLSAVYRSAVNHSHYINICVFLNLLLDIICPRTLKSHAGRQQTCLTRRSLKFPWMQTTHRKN